MIQVGSSYFFGDSWTEQQVPAWKHDCSSCTFLGTVWHEFELYDLYVHRAENSLLNTVVARFSHDGPDYESGLYGIRDLRTLQPNHPRVLAAEIALARGYLKQEDIK